MTLLRKGRVKGARGPPTPLLYVFGPMSGVPNKFLKVYSGRLFFPNIRLILGYNGLACLSLDVHVEKNEKYSYLDF